jgi:trans-2,3-dihydro-3-hydroxyanthranilate isomerase
MVELPRPAGASSRARANIAGLEAIEAEGVWPAVHLYVRTNDGFDIRAPMFAPLAGVPEDPATGSANSRTWRTAGFTTMETRAGTFSWRIAQGVEMGTPERASSRARRRRMASVKATWIGGVAVLVSEGTTHLD